MPSTYTWSPRVERLISSLPLADGRIPNGHTPFWSAVEASGDAALPPEVLAFLVRIAYQHRQQSAAERLFNLIWDRFAGYVVTFARGYIGRLQRKTTPEDVVVDVFTNLAVRLRAAGDVTFYEACFLLGLKRLTLDKVQRMPDEPLVSLTVNRDEGDEEEQQDPADHGAIDPQQHLLDAEQRASLREALPTRLRGLPPRVQQAAILLMQGQGEKEIARALGISTRMVTNYKATLRRALVEFTVSVRACDPESDVPLLVELYAAAQAADGSGEAPGAEDLHRQMRWPGHDPSHDRWVVEEQDVEGRLLAGCLVWKPPVDAHADMEVVVHPDWRRRGLGSMLVDRAAGRARDLGASHLGAYADDQNSVALSFAKKQSFSPVSAFVELHADSNVHPPPPVWPDGIAFRTYDTVGDPAILVQAMNRCYEGQWGHKEITAEDLAAFLPDLPADGIFLAFAPSDDIAGTCRIEIRPADPLNPHLPYGYIDAPGVLPQYRNTGLREALLLAAFHLLRAQGHHHVGLLSWGDDDATLSLYQSLGFTVARRGIYHQRILA